MNPPEANRPDANPLLEGYLETVLTELPLVAFDILATLLEALF